jgi:hypothetical protein
MSFIIEETAREPIPAGTHLAVCVSVVQLGLQEDKFGRRKKLWLRWELPELTASHADNGGKQRIGTPLIGRLYTRSLDAKANLRKHLESWLATKDVPRDILKVLGKPCMLSVTHRENGDSIFADVAAVIAAPANAAPKINSKLIAYDPDDHDPEVFDVLPDWVKEKIKARIKEEPQPIAEPKADDKFDNDIPF